MPPSPAPRPALVSRARATLVAGARRLPGAAGDRARFLHVRSRLDARDAGGAAAARELVPALLRRADAAHARHRDDAAIDWADKAVQLAWHPGIHYAEELSPLRESDLSWLQPFRDSRVGSMLLADPDAERPARPGGRRLLVLGASSWTFIDRVIERLRERDGLEVRVRDLADLPPAERPSRRGVLAARYALAAHSRRIPIPAALREDMEWADVIWMEWASYPAAWLTLLEGVQARTIVRLHSYEAFTPYPLMMDMAEVDDMVFVGAHVRNLLAAAAPRLAQAHRVDVVENVQDFSPFSPRKTPAARRTLLQVQWTPVVKDVEHSLDVLERLRSEDAAAGEPPWRLLLAGHPIPADARDARSVRIRERLDRLGDAVEVLGFCRDMPAVYARAGYILSSSRREGVHEAIAEGAASGCIPVVRDWPEYLAWGGITELFPADWIVPDVAAAVRRIRATSGAEFEAERLAAREWILGARRLERTLARHERLILGEAELDEPPRRGSARGG